METGNVKAMLDALNEIIDTIDEWRTNGEMEHWQYSKLFDIADAALAKPPRNCDKYNTADEAYAGFRDFCDKSVCSECRFDQNTTTCRLSWLYSEAEKEETK